PLGIVKRPADPDALIAALGTRPATGSHQRANTGAQRGGRAADRRRVQADMLGVGVVLLASYELLMAVVEAGIAFVRALAARPRGHFRVFVVFAAASSLG